MQQVIQEGPECGEAEARVRQSCRERLRTVLQEGLPALPTYIHELNSLLMSASVDLKKVSEIIRRDPVLSAQVIRLVNSALFGVRRRVVSIPDAAVLLGSERLRTLVLTCSVMQFTGKRVPAKVIDAFWRHSLLVGLLSERIARWIEYFETEQAYLAGLLHDVGQLPLWIVATEETASGAKIPENWEDRPEQEQALFGVDHCDMGRRMGTAWNFFPSLIDVFEHHHSPQKALLDPYLVGLVAAADRFTQLPLPASLAAKNGDRAAGAGDQSVFQQCLPHLCREEQRSLVEMLESEYIHLLSTVNLQGPKAPS